MIPMALPLTQDIFLSELKHCLGPCMSFSILLSISLTPPNPQKG
jgi:hypothetical protein